MSYVEEHMRKSLENHVLQLHCNTENLQAFFLKCPEFSRLMGSLILFTEEGIVITGDLTPGHHGVISSIGYGLNWFSGRLSEDYLCEKFLQKEFRPEKAIRRFKESVLDKRRHDRNDYKNLSLSEQRRRNTLTKEHARELWEEVERLEDEMNPWEFYELYSDTFHDTPEGCSGYNPGDAGWLCAIQQRFSALYQAEQEDKAAA